MGGEDLPGIGRKVVQNRRAQAILQNMAGPGASAATMTSRAPASASGASSRDRSQARSSDRSGGSITR